MVTMVTILIITVTIIMTIITMPTITTTVQLHAPSSVMYAHYLNQYPNQNLHTNHITKPASCMSTSTLVIMLHILSYATASIYIPT